MPLNSKKKEMPGGLWLKCDACGQMLFKKEVESRLKVCPSCNFHFTIGSKDRIAWTLDENSFVEYYANIAPEDRLQFLDSIPYKDKLKASAQKAKMLDAMVVGTGKIKGMDLAIGILDFQFMGGSMGEVVGEKVSRLAELAMEKRLPLVIFTSSGGARMHEGALSLMQMAKTCGALSRYAEKGGFYISVLCHPTTGGVTASFVSIADIILAELGALIGFAEPRVIATTIKQELPKGFQRSEFLLEKGQIDAIVSRDRMRDDLFKLLGFAPSISKKKTVTRKKTPLC